MQHGSETRRRARAAVAQYSEQATNLPLRPSTHNSTSYTVSRHLLEGITTIVQSHIFQASLACSSISRVRQDEFNANSHFLQKVRKPGYSSKAFAAPLNKHSEIEPTSSFFFSKGGSNIKYPHTTRKLHQAAGRTPSAKRIKPETTSFTAHQRLNGVDRLQRKKWAQNICHRLRTRRREGRASRSP